MEVRRLFDILPFYINSFGNKNILNAKLDGTWVPILAKDLQEKSDALAWHFYEDGIKFNNGDYEQQSKIALISTNRPEWVMIDFACQKAGGVLVPIYPSISDAEIEYILFEAEVEILIVEDKKLYQYIESRLVNLPRLKKVYSIDQVDKIETLMDCVKPIGEEQKKVLHEIQNQIADNNLATIIYTSGTTGHPKGVMLSHKNILSNVKDSIHCFSMCNENSNVLSFLPLNHIFERMVTYLYMYKGVHIFYAEGMETIGDNLREVKPSVFSTVPRLLEKVFERIEKTGHKLTGFKRKIFVWSLKLAEQFDSEKKGTLWYRVQLVLADKLVYKKWREAVGGNIKAIVTGSAACQIKLLRIFTAAKIVIMEGYGLTESSPVISVNTYESNGRRFGTVGKLIKNIEVKIAEDGEIQCKGNNVMQGYYKNPVATAESLKDGWLCTGDIGEYSSDGFLKITDRKKELFKISGGKYIAPLPLENKMKESPYIEQIMVVGSNQKFVGALVVPFRANVKDYFNQQGIEFKFDENFSSNPDLLKLIRQEINRLNEHFSEFEHIKRFQICPDEWNQENGIMTPTLKLKRKVIAERYRALLDKIFIN